MVVPVYYFITEEEGKYKAEIKFGKYGKDGKIIPAGVIVNTFRTKEEAKEWVKQFK